MNRFSIRSDRSAVYGWLIFGAWTLSIPWTLAVASASEPADISQLIIDLESDDPVKQEEAADALTRIVEDIRDAKPQMRRLLKSSHTETRLAGIRLLWAVRGESKAHLAILISALNDEAAYNRELAADLLCQLGPKASAAILPLMAALKDEDADVRISAALALGAIGPTAKSAIPVLVTALEDLGKASKGCFPHGTTTVSDAAGVALQEIGPNAIPAVSPLLNHDNKDIRINAMWVLAGGGEAARPHIPMLIEALNNEGNSIRLAAVEVLGELRIAPKESVAALAKMLKDGDSGLRFWSAMSLARYGGEAAPIIPELIVALQDEHPGVRAAAADALGEIGPSAKEAIPHLKRLCKDQDFFFHPHAMINYVAPHAKKALSRIRTTPETDG